MNKYIELPKQKVLININDIIRIAIKNEYIMLVTNGDTWFLKNTDCNKLYDKIKIFLGDPNSNLMTIE